MPASERHAPVLLLVGDSNLDGELARQGVAQLQPTDPARNPNAVWQVKTTCFGLGGDVCFVKGCIADVFDVEVGKSYPEKGMRKDGHDALGIVMRLPVTSATVAERSEEMTPEYPLPALEDAANNVADDPVSSEEMTPLPALEDAAQDVADELVKQLTYLMEEVHSKHNAKTLTQECLDELEPILAQMEESEELDTTSSNAGINKHELLADARATLKKYSEALAETALASEQSAEDAAQTTGPRNAISFGVYEVIRDYFTKRLNTEGIESTDGQLDKLSKLLYAKRQVSFNTDEWRDTKLAASILTARRAYADMHDVHIARVTKRVLVESKEGLKYWLNYGGEANIDDASELVVSKVSPQECAYRIHSVLQEREKWLEAQGLGADTIMTYDQRGEFLKWIMESFQQTPIEARLIAQARQEHKTNGQINRASRSRFSLEKQRRAGSAQIWELLSFTGKVTPEYLAEALENVKDTNSATERVAKDLAGELKFNAQKIKSDFRWGKRLERRERKYKDFASTLSAEDRRILSETKDGTLKRKVNGAVLASGRGRLRGDDDSDYLDIGTNRTRSVVQRLIDGEPEIPDTRRFRHE